MLDFAISDYRRVIPAVVLCLVAVVMVLELWQQYRLADVSGIRALLAAPGATPAVTEATQVLMLLLLLAIMGLLFPRTHSHGFALTSGYLTSLLSLLGYVFVVLLIAARTTGVSSGYGTTKLQFVLAGVFVPLAVIEVISRLEIGQQQLAQLRSSSWQHCGPAQSKAGRSSTR